MRLFIGLSPPANVRARLAALARGIPGARWVAPENLHITLAFVGEVGGGAAREIAGSLETIRNPCFGIDIHGVGHFGEFRRARSVWAGVERSEPLDRLRMSVLRRLDRAGFPFERRRYRPHVTLARLRDEAGHHLANFLSEHGLLRISGVPVEAVTLFRSHLSAAGASYEACRHYPLVPAG